MIHIFMGRALHHSVSPCPFLVPWLITFIPPCRLNFIFVLFSSSFALSLLHCCTLCMKGICTWLLLFHFILNCFFAEGRTSASLWPLTASSDVLLSAESGRSINGEYWLHIKVIKPCHFNGGSCYISLNFCNVPTFKYGISQMKPPESRLSDNSAFSSQKKFLPESHWFCEPLSL